MEVKAKARFIRMSPRKVRLVVDAIRGMKVQQAQTQLQFMKKAAAEPVLKLLNSAVANAEHNFKLNRADLKIASITANDGPTLGRWRARAFGRAAPIRKRMSHIHIVLTDGKDTAPAAEKKEAPKAEKKPAVKKEAKKPAAKKKATKKVTKKDDKQTK